MKKNPQNFYISREFNIIFILLISHVFHLSCLPFCIYIKKENINQTFISLENMQKYSFRPGMKCLIIDPGMNFTCESKKIHPGMRYP